MQTLQNQHTSHAKPRNQNVDPTKHVSPNNVGPTRKPENAHKSERKSDTNQHSRPTHALTMQQAANWFNVSKRTLETWIAEGMLDAMKVGRIVRITPQQIDTFITRNPWRD